MVATRDALPRVTTPTAVVIFGATGALAMRKLYPALERLSNSGMVDSLEVIGISRGELSDEAYRDRITEAVSGVPTWLHGASHVQGDIQNGAWAVPLEERLNKLGKEGTKRVIFYLAVAPSLFADVVTRLGESGLAAVLEKTSLVVEKPFGHSLTSAQSLDTLIRQYFAEEQVYRMDHYLGKDTVQNILALRFENGLFEPIWNNRHLDHVQITLAEDRGIGDRGAYYEEAGALRDVVQNHLLQLLAHIALEPPQDLSAESLRDRRAEVLRQLRPLSPHTVAGRVVRGQYGWGTDLLGERTAAYRQEVQVKSNSHTETFVALPVEIATERWVGVPFYLRAGKRLPKPVTEITLQFKPSAHDLYRKEGHRANLLTLRIQPNEGIALRLFIKKPGYSNELEGVDMSFCYRDSFREMLPEAYDHLLLDCLLEDQSLYPRTDEIESSWEFVQPILRQWKKADTPVPEYPGGSWGPAAAEALLTETGRQWWSDRLDVCPVPGTGKAVMAAIK